MIFSCSAHSYCSADTEVNCGFAFKREEVFIYFPPVLLDSCLRGSCRRLPADIIVTASAAISIVRWPTYIMCINNNTNKKKENLLARNATGRLEMTRVREVMTIGELGLCEMRHS